jgi:hypothetical protein
MDPIYKILENLDSVGKEEISEAPADEKRYYVTVGMMMYANSDEDVLKKAEAFASQLRSEQDNRATILSIYENPFGSLTDRKIFDKLN